MKISQIKHAPIFIFLVALIGLFALTGFSLPMIIELALVTLFVLMLGWVLLRYRLDDDPVLFTVLLFILFSIFLTFSWHRIPDNVEIGLICTVVMIGIFRTFTPFFTGPANTRPSAKLVFSRCIQILIICLVALELRYFNSPKYDEFYFPVITIIAFPYLFYLGFKLFKRLFLVLR